MAARTSSSTTTKRGSGATAKRGGGKTAKRGGGKTAAKRGTATTATKRGSGKNTADRDTGRNATRRAPRRRRPPARWHGLDVARGSMVALAAVLGIAAWFAPSAITTTTWQGLTFADLVPGAFLVLAGTTAGWRADARAAWTPRRRWQRGAILVAAGGLVALARAGADPALLGPEELVRLAAATGLAAWLAARHPIVPVLAAPVLLLASAALVTGHPLGLGLRGLDAAAAYPIESALGLAPTSVAALSFLPATGLVLIGHALGRWMHRRPPGPASGAALLSVALWTAVGVVVTAQLVPPAPALLTLPVASGAVALATLVLGTGHLAVAAGLGVETVAATGRIALVPAALGAAVLALLPAGVAPQLPVLAALTAGGVVAVAVALVGRWLARWPLRA